MNSQTNIAITAATDGACSGNPGSGGWGVLIIFQDGSEIEIGGSELNTTNNRMELTAAIKALEKLKNYQLDDDFKLRTDSKYVIEGYTKWIYNWKKNGWRTSNGKAVQNLDLWQIIDKLRINGLSMEFVKGHSGDPHNERVDQLATKYSKSIVMSSAIKTSNPVGGKVNDLAPKNIQNLFSRIELIEEFSRKGYLLKANELCDLLNIIPNKEINQNKKFEWRNWNIVPKQKDYWLIIKNN